MMGDEKLIINEYKCIYFMFDNFDEFLFIFCSMQFFKAAVESWGHCMGRFLAIFNLVKNQNFKNPVTDVIFRF